MRIIYVDVCGFELQLSGKSAGIQGEQNATILQIRFDDSWAGLGKRIIWRDATGENPVPVVLFDPVGADGDTLSYATAIPAAALAYPGWCSFTIEGCTVRDGNWVKAMGAVGRLEVRASEVIYQPEDETPSQAQQILAALGNAEQAVAESAEEAKSWAVGGTNSREGEDTDNAMYYAGEAANSSKKAAESEKAAAVSKLAAAESETAAAGSATAAAGSATSAGNSATSAAGSASAAAGSAATATEKATAAEGSETAAATSAMAAAGSAAAAGASETAAAASARAAAASEEALKTAEEAAETAAEVAKSASILAQNAAERAEAAREDDFGVQLLACAEALQSEGDWKLCYDDGVTVAVSVGKHGANSINTAYWSEDRVTWHQTSMPNDGGQWMDVAAMNGVFVAVRRYSMDQNKIAVSTDRGRTWEWARWAEGTSAEIGGLGSVCAGNGKFVALGQFAAAGVAWSEDGKTWNYNKDAFKEFITAGALWGGSIIMKACWGNGHFVACVYDGPQKIVLYSGGGENWMADPLPESVGYMNFRGIEFGAGVFAMVSSLGNIVTGDVGDWTVTMQQGADTSKKGYWYDICRHNGEFIVVGPDGGIAEGWMNNATVAWSADGVNWNTGKIYNPTQTSNNRLFSVTSCGGLAIACNYGELHWTRDGETWRKGGAMLTDHNGNDVTEAVVAVLEPYLTQLVPTVTATKAGKVTTLKVINSDGETQVEILDGDGAGIVEEHNTDQNAHAELIGDIATSLDLLLDGAEGAGNE